MALPNTHRQLRQRRGQNTTSASPTPVALPKPSKAGIWTASIRSIPRGSKLPGLSGTELALLRQKQKELAQSAQSTLQHLGTNKPHHKTALEASLIFAQYEGGSAVIIAPEGWVLTCAHCFGDTEEERQTSKKRRWLLTYTGLAVQAECKSLDAKRDLALLKIIAAEQHDDEDEEHSNATTRSRPHPDSFSYISLSTNPPAPKARLLCIGQPGRDDLESETARKTEYDLLMISHGRFRGMVGGGADPHDNSDIGTLKHDAWTYWGHSGAPLVREDDGTLVGLHSSWDDETGMRHGVPLVAIRYFVERCAELMGSLSGLRGGEASKALAASKVEAVSLGDSAKLGKSPKTAIVISDSDD